MEHTIDRVTTTELRYIIKQFIDKYHSYIKYADRPSRKMYWALYEEETLVGVFGLASAFSNPKAIKDWMTSNNILFNELGNNIVFCLYGNLDRNAGTKFLKLIRKDAVVWWKERYGDTLKALQCFVLPPRIGAVYKADNWVCLGETSGNVQKVKTLYGEDRSKYNNVEIRTFKSGEVKYLYRYFDITPRKLIFVKLLK